MTSLLELHISLLFLLIITSTAIAGARNVPDRLSVRLGAQKVQNLLEEAVALAGETGQTGQIREEGEHLVLSQKDRELSRVTSPDNLLLTIHTGEDGLLRFYSAISVQPARITIAHKNSSYHCEISLSLRGRVRKECYE